VRRRAIEVMSDYFFDSSVLDVVEDWVKKGKGKLDSAVEAVNREEPPPSGGGTRGLGFKGTSKKEAQAAANNVSLLDHNTVSPILTHLHTSRIR
jgi:hypothetical protein